MGRLMFKHERRATRSTDALTGGIGRCGDSLGSPSTQYVKNRENKVSSGNPQLRRVDFHSTVNRGGQRGSSWRQAILEVPKMQRSESVALLRALKQIDRGVGAIAKLLSEALAVDAKIHVKPPKSLIVMKRRIKL